MSEEEYKNRIGKIDAEISTDRLDADRGLCLLLQKLYLKDRYIEGLQQKVEQLENIRKEAIGYVTSYESISTIQGLDDIEKNKNLDEKTMNEMINRYLKVHDILLNILNKGSE